MNAGDWFVGSDAVSRALEGAPPTADFIIGHHLYRTLEGFDELHKASAFDTTWRCLTEGNLSWQWLSGVPGHQATYVRTQLLAASGYDTSFTIAADHEFMYRQRLNGAHFHHCDRVIALYSSGGYSWQNQIRCFQEWVEIARLYGPSEPAERLFRPAIRSAVDAEACERNLGGSSAPSALLEDALDLSAFIAMVRRIVKRSDRATRVAVRVRAKPLKRLEGDWSGGTLPDGGSQCRSSLARVRVLCREVVSRHIS